MHGFGSTVNLVIESIALMTLISFLLSVTLARIASPARRSWVMGAVLGIAASAVQLFPYELSDGVFIDLRAQMVAAAGAFFGWRGALIALVGAVGTRLGIGGAGTASGVLSLAAAAATGLAWRQLLPRRHRQSVSGSLILGLATPLHLIVPAFFMPVGWLADFYRIVGLPLALSEATGLILFGTLIQREHRLHHLSEMLREQAMHDPLTGLANRRRCVAFFERLPASTLADGVALLYLDADHFKSINDRHGHDAGDAVLRQIADILRAHSPPNGCAARIGGEEFCMILPSPNQAEATARAEQIRQAIARHRFRLPAGQLNISVSIGLHHTHDPEGFDARLNAADRALYTAKAEGRNRVVAWQQAKPVQPVRHGSGGRKGERMAG